MITNQVFLLLTNNICPTTICLFTELSMCTEGLGKSKFLYHHQPTQELPPFLNKTNSYIFTDDSLCKLGYFLLDKKPMPVNGHFPLLDFYLNNTQYDYYWIIEDDVRFTGSWTYFFEACSELEHADLLTSQIRHFHEEPGWNWWTSMKHPTYDVPYEKRLKSFNPIYRVSNKGLRFLCDMLAMQWKGHHEVLIATLFHLYDLQLLDFGGNGHFVKPGFENRFYTNEHAECTVRYRPVMQEAGSLQNKLYHPVKFST